MGKKTAVPAQNPAPASLFLQQQIDAIGAAIRAMCLVEVNVSGTLQRVLGIRYDAEGVSLLYRNDDKHLVLFRVRDGAKVVFQVTLKTQEQSEEPS